MMISQNKWIRKRPFIRGVKGLPLSQDGEVRVDPCPLPGNDAPALRQLGRKPKSERRRPTKKVAPKGA